MDSTDDAHASSHWRLYGARNTGYGSYRRSDPAEWIGTYRLALTAARARDVLRAFPLARRVSRQMELAFTQDSVRQLCTLSLLQSHLPAATRILLIGDGYGLLAGLLRATRPASDLALVDLSFALAEQQMRLTRAFGPAGFTFVHAAQLETLADRRFDLAINVASMQEMDPPEVARYFAFLRGRAAWFYCCNRERKVLPDGTVSAFADYPWDARDRIVLDELCPWHQSFLSLRPPIVRRYDGVHRHRLAQLAP